MMRARASGLTILAMLLLAGCTAAPAATSTGPALATATTPVGIVKTILLTDDDGWDADGIETMYTALTGAGFSVTLVAPHANQSGSSMSTTGGPLSVSQPDPGSPRWWVEGTPVDSVRVGLTGILSTPPDLVVSGINNGANAGFNVNYSGTVGAATAAAEAGVPAIAVSADVGSGGAVDYASGAALTLDTIAHLDRAALTEMSGGVILNVNVPVPGTAKTKVPPRRLATEADVEWTHVGYHDAGDGTFAPDYTPGDAGAARSDKSLLARGYATVSLLDVTRDGDLAPHPALTAALDAASIG
jgi:5'-nucleotidase